jgi:hypothetical protein
MFDTDLPTLPVPQIMRPTVQPVGALGHIVAASAVHIFAPPPANWPLRGLSSWCVPGILTPKPAKARVSCRFMQFSQEVTSG